MDTTVLGRTGLRVSRLGLGGGGHSRLGLAHGKPEAHAAALVQRALDLGVNFIDTAESYGTEEVVGQALRGRERSSFVLSTKAGVHWQDRLATAADMAERVDLCLRRLQLDFVDVFHLHGVTLPEYPYARDELLPALERLREAGKIRFVGITEAFIHDTRHAMLEQALADDHWDVVMVGFNLLNPSARDRVFASTQRNRVGTLGMFAVRRALSRADALREQLAQIGIQDDLEWVWRDCAENLQEAAYRFCRWEPGMDVVLCGTGNSAHLEQNVRAIEAPPLPAEVQERLIRVFRHVDTLSGN